MHVAAKVPRVDVPVKELLVPFEENASAKKSRSDKTSAKQIEKKKKSDNAKKKLATVKKDKVLKKQAAVNK